MTDAQPKFDALHDETRLSWNVATVAHNLHKRDQGAWLQNHSTLFPEEVALLGDIHGRDLLHLCCNSGQDTISLARHHGANCAGVDLSDAAIAAARGLARESETSVELFEDEVAHFLEHTERRFDVVFGSYGFLPWMLELQRVFRGISSVLRPNGRVVILEFHPMAWSFDERFSLKDPYFAPGRLFSDPVSDYVGAAGGALSPSGHQELDAPAVNPHRAHAAQHTVADIVMGLIEAGLRLEVLREWPWSNGCRMIKSLVPRGHDGLEARQFTTPQDVPSLPLMLGVVARKPG